GYIVWTTRCQSGRRNRRRLRRQITSGGPYATAGRPPPERATRNFMAHALVALPFDGSPAEGTRYSWRKRDRDSDAASSGSTPGPQGNVNRRYWPTRWQIPFLQPSTTRGVDDPRILTLGAVIHRSAVGAIRWGSGRWFKSGACNHRYQTRS